MGSVADDLRREQLERFASWTPAQRVALAERLGEEGLKAWMSTHGVDRAAAIQAIRKSRRVGRVPSRCADEDR